MQLRVAGVTLQLVAALIAVKIESEIFCCVLQRKVFSAAVLLNWKMESLTLSVLRIIHEPGPSVIGKLTCVAAVEPLSPVKPWEVQASDAACRLL